MLYKELLKGLPSSFFYFSRSFLSEYSSYFIASISLSNSSNVKVFLLYCSAVWLLELESVKSPKDVEESFPEPEVPPDYCGTLPDYCTLPPE